MSNLFDQAIVGILWLFNRERGQATMKFDAKNGTADIGGQTVNGRVRVNDANDRTAFILDAATRTIDMLDEAGNVTLRLDGIAGKILTAAELRLGVAA
jgi:hypothetical protein